MFSVYTTDRNLTYRIDAEGAYEAIEICRPAAESDGVRITGAAPYDALLGIDLAEGEVTLAKCAAACGQCGGWTSFGGMSHKASCVCQGGNLPAHLRI